MNKANNQLLKHLSINIALEFCRIKSLSCTNQLNTESEVKCWILLNQCMKQYT